MEMKEEALDRQLHEILDPLGVELHGPDGPNEGLLEARLREARQSGPFIEVVCLYAEEDERYWKQLFEHFTVLRDDHLSWHPCKVSKQWKMPVEELMHQLERAHLVLTLISVDLLVALIRLDPCIEESS